jgi:signal transduction histidine kinase
MLALAAPAPTGGAIGASAPWSGPVPIILLGLAVLTLACLLALERRRARRPEVRRSDRSQQARVPPASVDPADPRRGRFMAYASHALGTPLADTTDLAETRRQGGTHPPLPGPRSSAPRILIVDDEPINRQMIHHFLAPQGYRLEQAVNGAEALRILEEQPWFDLILLDIMMPELSGFAVCEEIRRHHPRETLPVVFLTANGGPADLTRGFGVGGNDYLIKPIAQEELLARVQTHLELTAIHRNLEGMVTQRTAQVEALTRKKEELLAIAAHDLRTPVVNLKGFAAELRADLESLRTAVEAGAQQLDGSRGVDRLWEDIWESLGFIDTASSRMETLVNGVVKLHRLSRIELEFERIDLQSLVEGIVENLEYQVSCQEAQVIAHSLPPVTADRNALEIILQNLLSNAVKYLVPQRPGRIDIEAERGETETLIQVRDNGRGIPDHEIPKVFKLFGRAGTQDTPGEGIGLAYVQTLVEQHGGRIECRSTVDGGTLFRFTLPHRELPGGMATARQHTAPSATGATDPPIKAVG